MDIYRILTLDGGGIKGLFTATLLRRLARRYPRLIDEVDLIAGTSTGGILALGLAAGRTPERLARLYDEKGPEIFDDSFLDDLVDLGHAIGADYGNRALKRELARALGKSTRLHQLSKRVLVAAFDLDAPPKGSRPRMWKPKFFHNFPGRDSDGRELALDVALRTSAAPTYFPTYQGFIDGGVVANNPSVAALAQALQVGKKLEQIVLLSLGTGTEPKYIRGKTKNWGWAQWARPLVSVMISGTMGVADYQCRQILRERYRRVDRYFDRGVDMDDASKRTRRYLVAQAKAVRLGAVVAWLGDRGW